MSFNLTDTSPQNVEEIETKMDIDREHEKAALQEAIFMLTDHAKGYSAHYLNHPAYQDVLKYAHSKLKTDG